MLGLVRGDGTLANSYTYTPWGETLTANEAETQPLRFAARELDPVTGMYYVRARWYDPHQGRFVSEDPIGLEGGINLYSYASNSPTNFRDPTGLCVDLTTATEKQHDKVKAGLDQYCTMLAPLRVVPEGMGRSLMSVLGAAGRAVGSIVGAGGAGGGGGRRARNSGTTRTKTRDEEQQCSRAAFQNNAYNGAMWGMAAGGTTGVVVGGVYGYTGGRVVGGLAGAVLSTPGGITTVVGFVAGDFLGGVAGGAIGAYVGGYYGTVAGTALGALGGTLEQGWTCVRAKAGLPTSVN